METFFFRRNRVETFTILPKRDANYKIPILFLTGLIWDLNLSLMKKYLPLNSSETVSLNEKKYQHTSQDTRACVYIYIYEFKAYSEAFVVKDDNPYYSYDQTLFERNSVATPSLVEDWFPISTL